MLPEQNQLASQGATVAANGHELRSHPKSERSHKWELQGNTENHSVNSHGTLSPGRRYQCTPDLVTRKGGGVGGGNQ